MCTPDYVMYMILLYKTYNRLILSRQQMSLIKCNICWNRIYGATRLFLHSYVIMLDNDIIVLLLVINPSLLTCYLSQGSVSAILTLVYPCLWDMA